jgi:hypothetical protein
MTDWLVELYGPWQALNDLAVLTGNLDEITLTWTDGVLRFDGPAGMYAVVRQAKKLKPGNKVKLTVLRELADTRNEERASKGIIATTSYLTSGALARVRRDEHLLGKVDRADLMARIARAMAGCGRLVAAA